MLQLVSQFSVIPGGDYKVGLGEAAIRRSGFLRNWWGEGDLRQIHRTRRSSRYYRQAASRRQAAEGELCLTSDAQSPRLNM